MTNKKTREQLQRAILEACVVTFETFDHGDAETWPQDQQTTMTI